MALGLGGTPGQPELTEVRRTPLPTPKGHDLQPVAARPDRLWITSKSKNTFLQDYRGADRLYKARWWVDPSAQSR